MDSLALEDAFNFDNLSITERDYNELLESLNEKDYIFDIKHSKSLNSILILIKGDIENYLNEDFISIIKEYYLCVEYLNYDYKENMLEIGISTTEFFNQNDIYNYEQNEIDEKLYSFYLKEELQFFPEIESVYIRNETDLKIIFNDYCKDTFYLDELINLFNLSIIDFKFDTGGLQGITLKITNSKVQDIISIMINNQEIKKSKYIKNIISNDIFVMEEDISTFKNSIRKHVVNNIPKSYKKQLKQTDKIILFDDTTYNIQTYKLPCEKGDIFIYPQDNVFKNQSDLTQKFLYGIKKDSILYIIDESQIRKIINEKINFEIYVKKLDIESFDEIYMPFIKLPLYPTYDYYSFS